MTSAHTDLHALGAALDVPYQLFVDVSPWDAARQRWLPATKQHGMELFHDYHLLPAHGTWAERKQQKQAKHYRTELRRLVSDLTAILGHPPTHRLRACLDCTTGRHGTPEVVRRLDVRIYLMTDAS